MGSLVTCTVTRSPLLSSCWIGGYLRLSPPRPVLGGIVVVLDHIRHVQEARLLDSDVDEGRLNAGKHRIDPSQEHVADQPSLIGAVQHEFHKPVVFQERHSRFARRTH